MRELKSCSDLPDDTVDLKNQAESVNTYSTRSFPTLVYPRKLIDFTLVFVLQSKS